MQNLMFLVKNIKKDFQKLRVQEQCHQTVR